MPATIQFSIFLSSICYPKTQRLKYTELTLPVFYMGVKCGLSHRKKHKLRVPENDVSAYEGKDMRKGGDCTMRSFMPCTPHQILLG